MKVILKKNIKGIGKMHDVKEVADGYALNFLLPSGGAVRATDELIHAIKNTQADQKRLQQTHEEQLKETLQRIRASQRITLKAPADHQGHLYQGVTAQEIAHTIREQHEIFIPKDYVLDYHKPIKERGTHEVVIGTKEHHVSYQVIVE